MTEIMTKLVYDCSTGEESIIPLTEEEIVQREKDILDAQEKMNKEIEKREKVTSLIESAKNKLVSGESLTEEEASVILQGINNI